MTETDIRTPSQTGTGHSLQIAVIVGLVVMIGTGGWLASGLFADKPQSTPAAAAPPPHPSPAASVDPAQQVAIAKVLAAYNHLEETVITAGATSDWNNKDIGKYAGGSLTLEIRQDLIQKQQQGLVTVGRPTWSATVISIDMANHTATIRNCFDGANWKLIYKATGKSAAAPGQAVKYVITATADLYDDGIWRIEDSQADRSHTC